MDTCSSHGAAAACRWGTPRGAEGLPETAAPDGPDAAAAAHLEEHLRRHSLGPTICGTQRCATPEGAAQEPGRTEVRTEGAQGVQRNDG